MNDVRLPGRTGVSQIGGKIPVIVRRDVLHICIFAAVTLQTTEETRRCDRSYGVRAESTPSVTPDINKGNRLTKLQWQGRLRHWTERRVSSGRRGCTRLNGVPYTFIAAMGVSVIDKHVLEVRDDYYIPLRFKILST
jgi:hypothetical protein